jgi:hypothetical protein
LLETIEPQRRELERQAAHSSLDRHRARAWSLLGSSKVQDAFDLSRESPRVLDAYGQNLFGWSCVLARRLIDSGVRMVQVNGSPGAGQWGLEGPNIYVYLRLAIDPKIDHSSSPPSSKSSSSKNYSSRFVSGGSATKL